MDKILLKRCLFYASWLALPFVAWLLWQLRERRRRSLALLLLVPSLTFAWARFIEPQMIRVQETRIAGTRIEARIALISDLHLGVYKDRAFLDRVVDRLSALQVDAVAIAGDFTYEPQAHALETLFEPLARLEMPVYAVLGNHDQQAPGPDIDVALRAALQAHGVRVIEGDIVEADGYRWAGLGDRWARRDDPGFLEQAPSDLPTLMLTHNPDSASRLSMSGATLVLAGHTHGGQIRIPGLYRHAIPSALGFDRGEGSTPGRDGRPVRVFTTAGMGEVGLPLRLFNPPAIDILELQP
ncbi:metallophosphoesterase [Luteimonas sp. 3794]|uniref:metallophosphoesterase n=1 Tax=Luteimonas sp. 3794 TaxID=2817730 RepID=UPI002856B916|nr:metallophosphoesterase [Luteimonas sp. 3794]MDR6990902.1 putative MPP superfamily phosphohydrolase [Luteimonas sp. 3794]